MINPSIVQAANAYMVSQSKKVIKPVRMSAGKIAHPFITISRETGAGGTSLGELLVDYLNDRDEGTSPKWRLFDKNLIEKVIEEHRLPGMYKNYLTESRFSEIQDTFETLMGLHPGMNQLQKKTCNTILNLALIGNVVIVGRGANIITKHLPGGFHLRLIADIEWKISRVSSTYHLSRKDAVKFIDEEDTRRKEYVKKLFNKNVRDPLIYDIVIKTNSIPFAEAAELISAGVLRRKQYQLMHAGS